MADSPSPGVKRRDQEKCSFCRQKRIKCEREPAGSNESRCKHCQQKGLSCTPNYRSVQDPMVPVRRSLIPGIQPSFVPGQHQAVTPHTPTTPINLEQHRVQLSEQSPLDLQSPGSESARIRELALNELRNLNELQDVLVITTDEIFRPPSCIGKPDYDWKTLVQGISETTHHLFVKISGLAIEAARLTLDDLADSILSRLFRASDKYPDIYDGRKYAIINRILEFYKRIEDDVTIRFLLEKLANLNDETKQGLDVTLCNNLAKSMENASEVGSSILNDIWEKQFPLHDRPQNLTLPPHLLATRSCGGSSSSMISRLMSSISVHGNRPGIFGIHPLHFAAATGALAALKTLNTMDLNIRDDFGRTPLFMAAANGHDKCCQYLLVNGASALTRDCHQHTAIELAARGGHLLCVQNLLESGAPLNPKLTGSPCCSTPLQAAFESETINEKLVWWLLRAGADPRVERPRDSKNAITLAQERGEDVFKEYMLDHKTCPNPRKDDLNIFDMIDESAFD